MIPAFDHVALRVADLGRAIEFYCDVLGWKLLSRTVDKQHCEAFAYISMSVGTLELLQVIDESGTPAAYEPPSVKPPYCPHVAIRVDHLDEYVEILYRKKVPIVKGPLEIPDMVKWLYIVDPDFNIIEFVQWIKFE